MTPPKEKNKTTGTDPKEMDINKLPDKEFKIIVLTNEKASCHLGANIHNLYI